MSWGRRLCCAAAAVALLLCLPNAAFATRGEAYDYTIRVWGGNQGTVDGAERADYTAALGQTFTLDKGAVQLADDGIYYVKGFRLSGQDELHAESFTVEEDMDFVVAYGVKGETVSYTLNFVEYGTGAVLAPPETLYGNVGDKPIEAYRQIDGYRPLFRNITGTLGDEGANSWTFEYVALEGGESGTVVVEGVAPAAAAAAGGAAAADAPGAASPQAEAIADGETPLSAPATEEIMDLDTPLAQFDADVADEPGSSLVSAGPVLAIFGGAAALVGGVCVWLALRGRRRRRRSL